MDRDSYGLTLGDMVSEYTPRNGTAMPWYRKPARPEPAPETVEDRSGLRLGV